MLKNFILSHIDDTLLKTMPDINQTLLQFFDVINLVHLLLHFSPPVSSMTQCDKWRKRLFVGIRVSISILVCFMLL